MGLSSASSMAAMTLGMESCEKDLGVGRKLVKFAYPLGLVLYKPGSIILFTVMACCMAQVYQLDMSPLWVTTAILSVTLLSIAVPPIPGGARGRKTHNRGARGRKTHLYPAS